MKIAKLIYLSLSLIKIANSRNTGNYYKTFCLVANFPQHTGFKLEYSPFLHIRRVGMFHFLSSGNAKR